MTQKELRGNITESMNKHVENQLSKGLYDSRAEYLRSMVRNDIMIHGGRDE